MTKTDDYRTSYFEARRKYLDEIIADLKEVRPLEPIESHTILRGLAVLVKMDTDILEKIERDDTLVWINIRNLNATVHHLVDELRKTKDLELRLEGIAKQIADIETTSNKYLDTYDRLKKVIDDIRKVTEESNKKKTDYIK